MTYKIYWGLGILIVLLSGALVLILLRNTDTEPIKVYNVDVEPSKEVMNSLHILTLKNNLPLYESDNIKTTVVANGVDNNKHEVHISVNDLELLGSSRTIRQRNQKLMDYLSKSLRNKPIYDFYKKYPDFDHNTASPEIIAEHTQAFYDASKIGRSESDRLHKDRIEVRKNQGYEPIILGPVSMPDNTTGDGE